MKIVVYSWIAPVPGLLIISVIFIEKGSRVMKEILNEKVSSLDLQRAKEITLLEVLDKALNKGVIIGGDLVISVADVDLIYIGIKILLSSIETMNSLSKGKFVN